MEDPMRTLMIRYVAMVLVWVGCAGLVWGCGNLETLPGESDPEDRSRSLEEAHEQTPEVETPKADTPVRGDVARDEDHERDGGWGETDGQTDADGNLADPEDEDPLWACRMLCELVEACYGLPAQTTLIECRVGCEVSRYDGSVMDRDIRCMGRAESCTEVRDCVEDLWGCDGPCDAATGCEIFDDGTACRQWCAPQVISGTTTMSQLGCMETEGRHQRCRDMGDRCHLDGFPSP
jgi:hypothetical protein